MRMPPRLDFDYVCRLCMVFVDGARNGQFVPLFREEQSLELARKIADIADVEVTRGDGLPGQVCRSCIEQVDACHAFRQKCRNSDVHFRRYISEAYLANSALPSTSGYGNALTSSSRDRDTDTSGATRPTEVNIVKEVVERAKSDHYVQAREDKLKTEVYKLNKDESLAGPEGNLTLLNTDPPKHPHPQMFPNGPVWLAGGDTLHMRELLHNVSTWLAVGEAGAGRWGRHPNGEAATCDAYNGADAQENKYRPSARPQREADTTDEGPERKRSAEWSTETSRLTGSYECYPGGIEGAARVKQEGDCEGEARRGPPKKFRCEVCGKALGSEGSLKVHRLNHSGARPFQCTVDGCTKSFSQYGNLQTHIRSHLGIKPYACKTCGSSFVQLANLQSHERKHTGARPYPCRYCDEAFAHMSSLHSHVLWHHSERMNFECSACGKRFKTKNVLGKHVEKMHNGAQQ